MHGRLIFLAIFAAAMFLFLLGRRQFAASHEARVADPAREMAASGWAWNARKVEVPAVHLVKKLEVLRLAPDPQAPPLRVNPWIVPVLTGEIRLQKPPLPYWCAAALYRLFHVSEATTRLVPALLGFLATFLLYDLAGLLYGPRVAWAAALFWLSSYLIPEEYRLAMADPYLAFFTLLALWSWIRASPMREGEAPAEPRSRHAPRAVSHGTRSVPATSSAEASPSRFILLFYISLALGALAKGPLIFLHAAVPIILFHVTFRGRMPRGWMAHSLGLAIFAAISLPWPLAVLRQVPNAIQLWRYESVGEVSGENQEGLRAGWYYFQAMPQMAAPWVALWLFAMVFPFLRRRRRAFFPFVWYGLMVLIFSKFGQKKLPYLLPIMPAQVLMLAVSVVPLLRVVRRLRMRKLPGAIVAVQTVIGTAWALSLPVLLWHEHDFRPVPIAISLAALAAAVVAFHEMRSNRPASWLVVQSVAYALIVLVFCDYYLTDVNNARSPVPVCREVKSMADGTHRVVLESRVPEEVAFYLPLHATTGPAPRAYLVVLDDQLGVEHRAKTLRPPPQIDPQHFDGWVPGAKVVGIRRVEMQSAPGDARWKVYELTVTRTALAER